MFFCCRLHRIQYNENELSSETTDDITFSITWFHISAVMTGPKEVTWTKQNCLRDPVVCSSGTTHRMVFEQYQATPFDER